MEPPPVNADEIKVMDFEVAKVHKRHADAFHYRIGRKHYVIGKFGLEYGSGDSKAEAWQDAARRLDEEQGNE